MRKFNLPTNFVPYFQNARRASCPKILLVRSEICWPSASACSTLVIQQMCRLWSQLKQLISHDWLHKKMVLCWNQFKERLTNLISTFINVRAMHL